MADQNHVIPSRTQRKREALLLQKTGQQLVDLDPGDLARVPLPEPVTEAIGTYHRIRSREARRRQLRYIGKLMRKADMELIDSALELIHGESASARYELRQLEIWRERLIEEPVALTEYLASHPLADRQRLRQQLVRVQKAQDDGRRKTESRALFRLLKSFS